VLVGRFIPRAAAKVASDGSGAYEVQYPFKKPVGRSPKRMSTSGMQRFERHCLSAVHGSPLSAPEVETRATHFPWYGSHVSMLVQARIPPSGSLLIALGLHAGKHPLLLSKGNANARQIPPYGSHVSLCNVQNGTHPCVRVQTPMPPQSVLVPQVIRRHIPPAKVRSQISRLAVSQSAFSVQRW
jgi:hypothetical protein